MAPHAAKARGIGQPQPTVPILDLPRDANPAGVLGGGGADPAVPARLRRLPRCGLANLGLAQVFVPLTLTEGLTQMWSLSVEVAFFVLLPLFAYLMVRLRGNSARSGYRFCSGCQCWR